MIAHLSGTLLSKQATSVILDVGGVGYEVTIPISTFYELEEPGSKVQLRIYTHVREDALLLYGFKTARERELFMRLISVSGIGPKLGITLLSGMSADEMIASIRTNNLARLTLIPGVGRKTAERLVMELRDKIAALSSPELEEELGAKPSDDAGATPGRHERQRRPRSDRPLLRRDRTPQRSAVPARRRGPGTRAGSGSGRPWSRRS